ncbi:DUF2625 domain-containing protein [Rhodocytophaga aerolata]|uniref:DUF2625 domain-containing protein n=1 Tax=Rhodocytophaga aerolata TaxID=455078 RepID=UPI0036726A24
MKHCLLIFSLLLVFQLVCTGQTRLPANSRKKQTQHTLKSIDQLIDKQKTGWELVMQWKKDATNQLEILPKNQAKAETALHHTQVSTRSPMGAIIYETGGILIDGGWLRILGSGAERMDRTLPEWNKGKAFDVYGEQPSFLLVADDVLGGFFAINGGGISNNEIGKIFYFAPDNLKWESTGLDYANFIIFCFSGALDKFYEGLRWTSWQQDVKNISGDKGLLCDPLLYTKGGQNINKVKRKLVPVQELWDMYFKESKEK